MDGVTILNEFVCLSDGWFALWLGLGLCAMIVAVMYSLEDYIAAGFVVFWIAGAMFGVAVLEYQASHVTRFEALVDQSVSATEFMDKYEVIGRKGDIWVLEPLEDESDDEEDV